MIKMTYRLCGIVLFFLSSAVSYATVASTVTIASDTQLATIVLDAADAKVVQKAAEMLADDVLEVSGKRPEVASSLPTSAPVVIIAGTVDRNRWIQELIKANKLDVTGLKGAWERYAIQQLDNPLPGIKKAIVVVGSDRRGAAYGLLELSRMAGVSPWTWWADVKPKKQFPLSLSVQNQLSTSPSVKYRGIFINDEDWGIQVWAAKTFEPETGDMGPKTYGKVFELLLRLRANTIWPAMHTTTTPFYLIPANKQMADDYAIVIGTSHAEPMLSNINGEWDNATMGEYRYDTNPQTIGEFFRKRATETAQFENIYTVGMRGKHDSPMIMGEDDSDSQVALLDKVITDQRKIIADVSGKSAEQTPQAFVPYKEVLGYYQKGLKVPDDISLVWTDDNYGYIRQLSNPQEQQRSGGAGVYYHTSYWGRPHDYLWLNSTNPVLMWEELHKAWQLKTKNIWILNAGDIKPHEYNIELFMDMAWHMDDLATAQAANTHRLNWAKREFGDKYGAQVSQMFADYYQLVFQRRPEFMAWSEVEPVTLPGSTELTQIHYGDEVARNISAWHQLMAGAETLQSRISAERQDAYYELVYYPLVAAASLNLQWLYHYKNVHTAEQGRGDATWYAQQSAEAHQRIAKETTYYNQQLAGGKWQHMMSSSPRNLPVFSQPSRSEAGSVKAGLGVALEGYDMVVNDDITNSFADVLPLFNAYTQQSHFIDVYSNDAKPVHWQAKPAADWITLSQTEGTLKPDKPYQRLWVSIDWSKVPAGKGGKEPPLGHDHQLIPPGYKINSTILLTSDSEKQQYEIGVSAYNPKFKDLQNFKGFVENTGYVSIDAEHFQRQQNTKQAEWQILPGLGYTNAVVMAGPYAAPSVTDVAKLVKDSPVLEYDFYTFNFGQADIWLQAIPSHAMYAGRGVKVAVAIDEQPPVLVDFQTFGRSESWMQNVLKNAAKVSTSLPIIKAGKHTLKVWMVDPGVMLDQILIDLGGWKASYAFPPETKLKH